MGRVVIAGGGTGGHLYPGLALADALAARDVEVVYVGTASGIEARVVPETRYPLRLLPGRQVRGGGVAGALAGGVAAGAGLVRALLLLGRLKPRLVVGVGGYASVAVVLAATLRRLPTLLLEQNVVPGAANRFLGRRARRVCVGFAASVSAFPEGRAVHTGNPLRPAVLAARTRPPHARLGVLVFGGSGGAHHLNEAAVEALCLLGDEPRRWQVTHQTGPADCDSIRARYAALGLETRVEPFIADMGGAYTAADVVVGRAGAMTCSEVAAVGLPSILVPYPYAADDHQRRNAEVLVAGGAATMIPDAELDGARLASALRELAGDPARRLAMAERARALGRPDAAERVAEECLRLMAA